MKKEGFALILLMAVILGSFLNLRYIRRFTGGLELEVREAWEAAQEEDWPLAEKRAAGSMERWTGADKYTHIFIRHGEIDAVTDGFCDLLGAVRSRDLSEVYAAQLALRCRLTGLYEMERLTPGSIL